MQPYSYYNPMYQQPVQQPMQYMDRLSQLQSQQYQQMPQQATNQFSAIGKIVDGIDVVRATDIPMDGNMYYFPKADGSEIYGKKWGMDGRTHITAFKPVLDGQGTDDTNDAGKAVFALSDEVTGVFMKRFDDLSERLERVEKSIKPNSRKKEVAPDE